MFPVQWLGSNCRHLHIGMILREKKPVETSSNVSAGSKSTGSPKVMPSSTNTLGSKMANVGFFTKYMLWWIKKYPNLQSVPAQVTLETIQEVHSKMRMRMATLFMAITAVTCVGAVWSGKRAHKKGDSLVKRNLDWHESLNKNSEADAKKPT